MAVRLCGLVYFFAFFGNVIDGPVMWLLLPPSGASTARHLLRKNQVGCLASLVTCFRPKCWGALLLCWPLWYESAEHGRRWFNFGWDQMMNEVGFYCILLSMTLSMYDDVATCDEQREEDRTPAQQTLDEDETLLSQSGADMSPSESLHARKGTTAASSSSEGQDGGKANGGPSQDVSRVRSATEWWQLMSGTQEPLAARQLQPCGQPVTWARDAVEVSLTLVAFRLFLAAGMLKMRRGSDCWRDHTCLYDHFETQPMPNAVAWYVNALAPHWALRLMQWFSIDVAEVWVPYLFLGCLLTMGPVGLLHERLLTSARNPLSVHVLLFPARFLGALLTMVFVCGMFVSGNYAFLHVLSLVPLLACMSTVHGQPLAASVQKGIAGQVYSAYRLLAPFVVLFLCLLAFLPSLQAYAWLTTGSEYGWPMIGSVMQLKFVQQASSLHLGIPYNRHAYFAGAVHSRNEVVLFGDFGGGWIELDIPYKVGRESRRPAHTAPLHRRFAWEWWFLELGEEPDWLFDFMNHLCAGNPVAWNAIEAPWPAGVDPAKMRRVGVRSYNYHFTTIGGNGTWWPEAWWTRQDVDGLTPPFDMPCK